VRQHWRGEGASSAESCAVNAASGVVVIRAEHRRVRYRAQQRDFMVPEQRIREAARARDAARMKHASSSGITGCRRGASHE